MNKNQKEVIQYQLDSEKAVLDELRKQYQKALDDIDIKIRILQSDELTQSKIYQLQYQKVLKGQVEGILEKLHGDEFTTIQQFLTESYTTGFVGTMYDLHGQNVPLILPIDQNAAVKAVLTDSKVKEGLYETLGVDVNKLKKSISGEITRGIASGLSYHDIARNISNATKAPYSRAKTIVRTEAHRIQQASTMDAQRLARSKGADVVKQWDATLDGDTRPTHRKLDGQIREVDKPFEANGKKAMFPGDFGDPAEDCNCRCVSLSRARWALDEGELKTLQKRAEFFGLDKTDDFEEFRKTYLDTTKKVDDYSRKIISKTSEKTRKTLENNTNLLYNNTLAQKVDTKAQEAYNRSIAIGELSPMASFELYQAISKEIDDILVGTTTANGIEIKSKSDHFIARVIGSVAQRRSGVSIEDVVLALTNPDRIDPVRKGPEGNSQRFMKHGVCAVTINPDTGNLIQVNPLR